MKTIFTTILFFSISVVLIGQEPYQLGYYYKALPSAKQILVQQMVGGTEKMEDGSIIHWDGFKDFPLQDVDYDTTTLYIIGNIFIFKEYLNPSIDLKSLKLYKAGFDRYSDFLIADKNGLYSNIFYDKERYSDDSETIKILKDKKFVKNRLYQGKKNGLYYFIDEYWNAVCPLAKAPETMDINSLTHLWGNYFYDKNNFYFFGNNYISYDITHDQADNIHVLESTNGLNIIPEIHNNYIAYNGSVYAKKLGLDVKSLKLDLNINTIKEYRLKFEKTFLSDGRTSYKDYENVKNERLNKTANWVQIASEYDVTWIVEEENKTLSFPSSNMSYNNKKQSSAGVVKDGNKYLLVGFDNDKIQEYDSLKIYNLKTDGYENLNINKYRYIGERLYVYDGVLYTYYCYPVEGYKNIDLNKLRVWNYKNKETYFYTDGKVLMYQAGRNMYDKVDFGSLRAISKDILIDKNNIYQGESDGIKITPVDDLNLKIIQYTLD